MYVPTMRYLSAALVLLVACSGDPIESASNCTELTQAGADVLADLEPGTVEYLEAVIELQDRALELRGDALADNALAEAAACDDAPWLAMGG